MRLKVSDVCQLLDKDNLNSFVVGNLDKITVTDNKDGTFIINGSYSNTYNSWYILNEWNVEKGNISQIVEGHKYLLLGDVEKVSGDIHLGINIWYVDGSGQSNYAGIITSLKTTKLERVRVQYSIHEGDTADNAISKPQLFDLTEMYGAGHEPTTVAQFRQDFPNEMYEYSPVCWKKFRRLKYIANKEPVQLLDKTKYRGTSTREGITFTNNGDGTWTVVGTAPDVPANKEYVSTSIIIWNLEFSKKHFIPGHKIVVAGGVSIDSAGKVADVQWVWGWTGGYDAANSWERTVHTIKQYPEDKLLEWSNYIELRVYAGATVNFTFKPQFFDLTEMYGAGNEPTTVAQFRADFPNELYDYNPYNYLTLNRGKYIANKEPVQLLDKSKFPATKTENGITWTNNGDGTITANGTATNRSVLFLKTGLRVTAGKYCVLGKVGTVAIGIDVFVDDVYSSSPFADRIFTIDKESVLNVYLVVENADSANSITIKPQLFDLTAMYGAGNEPTTVEQFRQDFPNELYDYNPYNAITFR